MARPNYQREKRLKDLARQQKQEEKRARRFQGDKSPSDAPAEGEGPEGGVEAEEGVVESEPSLDGNS